jgi:hypothetical protein
MDSIDTDASKTTWPVKAFLVAVVFAWLTMAMFSAALDGPAINAARLRTQAGICLILILRLLWAIHRRERNRIWIAYLIGMVLAAPIWLIAEPWLFVLRRWWIKGG